MFTVLLALLTLWGRRPQQLLLVVVLSEAEQHCLVPMFTRQSSSIVVAGTRAMTITNMRIISESAGGDCDACSLFQNYE